MRPSLKKGELIKWDDDRSLAFIRPSEGSQEVFLHISGVKIAGRRPKVGDILLYE